jgi:hypothetical protein
MLPGMVEAQFGLDPDPAADPAAQPKSYGKRL